MAKRQAEPQPAIRKSFLITGGVAIGAALLGFILMTFVLGGGGGSSDPAPTPAAGAPAVGSDGAPASTPAPTERPAEPDGLTPGGRDPFRPIGGQAAPAAEAPAPAPEPVVEAASFEEPSRVDVLSVYATAADIKVDDAVIEGAKGGLAITPTLSLTTIDGSCAIFEDAGQPVKVCEGQTLERA